MLGDMKKSRPQSPPQTTLRTPRRPLELSELAQVRGGGGIVRWVDGGGVVVEVAGPAAARPRPHHPARRDRKAERVHAEVEHERRGPLPAPARELPGPDLGLAADVGLVAGDDVVEVVDADRAAAA